MLFEIIKRYKTIIIIISIFILGFVAYSIYTLIDRVNKQAVIVYKLPSDMIVTANNIKLKQGKVYLEPGEYSIKATRSGFEEKEYKTTITKNNNEPIIDIALTPVSQTAKKWAEENASLYNEYSGRQSEKALQEGRKFFEANPIANSLPYENLLYTIGYRLDPKDISNNSIILEIDASTGYRNAAIDQIFRLGYNPTDYKINFRNYESPFDHE